MMLKGKRNKIWAIPIKELSDTTLNSDNLAQILKKFGFATTSSNYVTLKTRLKHEKIDFDHISLGRNSNSGRKFPNKKVVPLEQILVENSSYSRTHLKKRLLKVGLLKNECACGQGPEWNGKPLTMQIDHINGIANDNRLENLRMICPNCHSQTETFSGRNVIRISSNGKTNRSERSDAGSTPAIRTNWRKQSRLNTRKVIRPNADELKELLWSIPSVQIATQFGVSDKTIEKWCKQYGLNKPSRGYWTKNGFVKIGERLVADNYPADIVVLNDKV